MNLQISKTVVLAGLGLALLICMAIPASAQPEGTALLSVRYDYEGTGQNEHLGHSVSGAGDVNGDGFDDFIAIANGTTTSIGRAVVCSGFDGSRLYTFYGDGSPGQSAGGSVSGAGDVNGDGFADLIVGSTNSDGTVAASGAVWILSGIDGSTLQNFHGDSSFDRFGEAVSDAGDVNGDGVPDIIVGMPGYHVNGLQFGGARVFSGAGGGILHTFLGDSDGENLGASVSGAGDINGDGFDDLIVGSLFGNPDNSWAGSACVYSGFDGSTLFTLTGSSAIDYFGSSVSNAGDVNNDGIPDVIVGARLDNQNGPNAGSVRIFSGADGAILHTYFGQAGDRAGSSVSDFGDVDNDGYVDVLFGADFSDVVSLTGGMVGILSGKTGAIIDVVGGANIGARFGASVSGVGDVNGDGRPDFVVGAPSRPPTFPVFAMSGGFTVFTANPADSLNGAEEGDRFGRSVAGIGDVNGDGSADVLIGAPAITTGYAAVYSGSDESLLYAVQGDFIGDQFGNSVSGTGDVNGDGVPDFIVGAFRAPQGGTQAGQAKVFSGVDGSVLATHIADSVNDAFGFAVSGAGDVNNDGFGDYIVGAPRDDNNGTDAGSARVFSGFDGSILYTFHGPSPGGEFGFSVSEAGDVNGDGYSDVIVGAHHAAAGGFQRGRATIFSGLDGSTLYTRVGLANGDKFGQSVSGAGDVNGDGLDDFIVGAPFSDELISDEGSAHVFSGADGSLLHFFFSHAELSRFGISVSSAGDFNGDGFDDVIIGTDRHTFNLQVQSGAAYVFSGSNGTVLRAMGGNSANDAFGFSVAGIGDVNGDRFADVIVGAFTDDVFGTNMGSARIVTATALPTLSYSSDLGTIRLRQTWIPDGGDPEATTGSISCVGATPGGAGIVGLSLAEANIVIFGFPLLIANDPINLIFSSLLGFDVNGERLIPNVSLHNPFLAGSNLYLQLFESSPIPSGSNGLRLTIVP